MFFHLSVTTCLGAESDWGYSRPLPSDLHAIVRPEGRAPVRLKRRDYEQLHREFNPRGFDAQAWVDTAAAAGAGYVVLTAKNHDGFCFWDTGQTDYKITSDLSPFSRDIVAEVAKACHESGMRLGLHYSQRDWHHPDYLNGNHHAYQAYMDAQLRELLTGYGTIDILYIDSYGPSGLSADRRVSDSIKTVRELQPGILINNRPTIQDRRNGDKATFRGDFDAFDQRIGPFQTQRAWESRISLQGNHWGYRPGPDTYSQRDCVHALARCATGDGNLLLGVAPNAIGLIPDDQRGPLIELGRWMSAHGSTIRETRGYPVAQTDWGGATQTSDAVYLHILDPKQEPALLPAFETWDGPAEVLTGGTAEIIERRGRVFVEVSDVEHESTDTIIKLSR